MGTIGLLLAGLLAVGVSVVRMGHLLTFADAPSAADAIVILGGESESYSRTRQAVELFNQGYAPRVVFSGGTMRDFGLACSSAQFSLEAAQELGLPKSSVVISDEAQSTYDEAVNLARLARERGWRSLIVVTDPFHTRRAGRTFRTLMPGVSIYIRAAPDPRFDPGHWWRTEEGLVAAVNEVLKLVFYWVNYGISPF